MELCSAYLCAPSNVQLCVEKCDHLPPPLTHTFVKRPFLIDLKKNTHTPPRIWLHGCTSEQNLFKKNKKWRNAQSWHIMNEAERCTCRSNAHI